MDLQPTSLWGRLSETLPTPYALLAFLLISGVVILLVIYPVFSMVRSEWSDFQRWRLARQRAAPYPEAIGLDAWLRKVVNGIDALNRLLGGFVAWLAVFMVLLQFAVVLMRYVFSIGSIPMQEAIWYMHGMLFMLGAGATLLQDGHVRVDIFYREASDERKAWINLIGVVLFVLPLCWVTWSLCWGYVANAWAVKEASTEADGLPYIYLLKTVILVFLATLGLQAVSLAARSLLVIRGDEAKDLLEQGGAH